MIRSYKISRFKACVKTMKVESFKEPNEDGVAYVVFEDSFWLGVNADELAEIKKLVEATSGN